MSFMDWREELDEEKRQNRKLEAVAYLRNKNTANRQRMGQVRSILYGEPYLPQEEIRKDKDFIYTKTKDITEKIDMEQEDAAFWISFFRRTIACVVVIALIYMGDKTGNATVKQYKQEIKSYISVDYSENLFDFIQQIPYTFDYEKINVKR